MRIGDLLDELRGALPDCELCAFVDLDVELALSVSANNKPRQEQLDALAHLAASVLRGRSGEAAGLADLAVPPVVTIWSSDRTVFLQRSSSDQGEGVACVCNTDPDAKAVTSGLDVGMRMIGEMT